MISVKLCVVVVNFWTWPINTSDLDFKVTAVSDSWNWKVEFLLWSSVNLAQLVQLLNILTRSCSAIVDIVVYSVEITDMRLNMTKALIWDFCPGHCLNQALQTLHVFNYLLNSTCSGQFWWHWLYFSRGFTEPQLDWHMLVFTGKRSPCTGKKIKPPVPCTGWKWALCVTCWRYCVPWVQK